MTDDFIYKYCPANQGTNPSTGREFIQVGDDEDDRIFVLYHFDDRRLVGVGLRFPTDLFDDLLKLYRAKLGAESKVETEILTTRLGAKYENEIATWLTADGIFKLQKYSGDIEHGGGQLFTEGLLEKFDREQKAKEAELKEKL